MKHHTIKTYALGKSTNLERSAAGESFDVVRRFVDGWDEEAVVLACCVARASRIAPSRIVPVLESSTEAVEPRAGAFFPARA